METLNSSSKEIQRYLPEPLWDELTSLLREEGRRASRTNKQVSHETMDHRRELLTLSLRELRGLGYKIESVRSLKQKHVEVLVRSWEDRKLSASTIANRISCLRLLANWIGKPGMVQRATDYVSNPNAVRRVQATSTDKSWSAAGVDPQILFNTVEQHDWRVGLQLKLMDAFGLRRKEAVIFKPHMSDLDVALRVRDGTKGGRERVIPIETKEQRELLDFAKSKVPNVQGSICHPDLNLEQAIRRFNYVLEKFGVTKRGLGITSHGLRHEHLNDLYEKVAGVPSPVRSTNLTADIDDMTHDLARARVSQEAGHARLGISNAYIGARTGTALTAEKKELKREINHLLAKDDLSKEEVAQFKELFTKFSEGRAG